MGSARPVLHEPVSIHRILSLFQVVVLSCLRCRSVPKTYAHVRLRIEYLFFFFLLLATMWTNLALQQLHNLQRFCLLVVLSFTASHLGLVLDSAS